MLRARRPYLLLALVVVVLDQLSKWLVASSLPLHDSHPLIEGLLSLSHVRNRGAAFGLLSDADLPYQGLIFGLISLVALAAIAVYSLRTPAGSRLPQLGLALVLGGALGNLADRLRLGYVVDFIHVYWRSFQWWDFNLADSCISVGVALLLLDTLLAPHSESVSGAGVAADAVSPGRGE